MSTAQMSHTLKTLRKQHKLNQTQFAQRLQVTQQAVSQWERGKALPALNSIIQICQSLQIPFEHLIQSA